MNTIHMTFQGKGGVGKSWAAAVQAQYLLDKGTAVLAIDTDPVNATLAAYKRFEAHRIRLLSNGAIDTSAFDTMVELALGHDGDVVVDNGASSFVALGNYLVENPVISIFEDSGRSVVIHTVIAGGSMLAETLDGFVQTTKSMPESVKIVVWLNEHFGPIADGDGKGFEDFPVYKKLKDRIAGLITLPKRTEETYGRDLQTMIERRVTFAEAREDVDGFKLMARQRLATVQKDIYAKLDAVM
ncbi:MAG: conjugal transfer protein TraL [Magnetospirillum sp.]|nr:conjugal transfer protein TraL [Magnetospirillum sp.]